MPFPLIGWVITGLATTMAAWAVSRSSDSDSYCGSYSSGESERRAREEAEQKRQQQVLAYQCREHERLLAECRAEGLSVFKQLCIDSAGLSEQQLHRFANSKVTSSPVLDELIRCVEPNGFPLPLPRLAALIDAGQGTSSAEFKRRIREHRKMREEIEQLKQISSRLWP